MNVSPRVAFLIEKPAPGVHEMADAVDVVDGVGFSGDHAKKSWWRGKEIPGRHVSAITLEFLREHGLAPDLPGDNLVTEGVDLSALRAGDRLVAGDVVLERSDREHRPCSLFRARAGQDAFDAAADGRRGALFVVVSGGSLKIGQPVEVRSA